MLLLRREPRALEGGLSERQRPCIYSCISSYLNQIGNIVFCFLSFRFSSKKSFPMLAPMSVFKNATEFI